MMGYLEKLEFSKDWTKAEDFPTYEPDESQVRADLQLLHNEAKAAINALVGGHVDVAIGSPPTYRDYVINGELNCLGTFIPEGLEVEGIGHISSFRDQGVDVDFTGMDYFAVRSSVDDSKKEVLTNFIAEVYADPEFQEFMKGMGMEAWEATESEIVDMVEAQTEAMTEYIPLVQ